MKTLKINTIATIFVLFCGSLLFQTYAQTKKTHGQSNEAGTTERGNKKLTPTTVTKFTLSPTSLSFSANGETQYVSISPSSTEWTSSNSDDLVSVSKDENDNTIVIRCKANPSSSPHNSKITIKSGEQREIITISQAGKTEIIKDENRFSIQSIDIASFDKDGKAITNYGDPISPNTQYIIARFIYDNLQTDKANINLSVIITDPNGKILKNDQSNNNYSLASVSIPLEGDNKSNQAAVLPKFGNVNENLFSTQGTYSYDIYCNGQRKASGKFTTEEKQQVYVPESSIKYTLTLSNNNIYFDNDGTTSLKYVRISTDADYFSYTNVPSWLKITRDGNYIYFSADKYYKTDGYRSENIKINAGGTEKTIYVAQSGPSPKPNPFELKNETGTIGLSVGYVQKSWTSRLDDGTSGSYGIWGDKPINGIQAGIKTDFYFKPDMFGLGIATGLFYEYYYSKSDVINNEVDFYNTFQEHSLYLPIHLIYRFDINRNFGIFIKGGVGLDYGISAKYNQTVVGDSSPSYTSDDLYGDKDFGVLTRFNASGEFGGGIQIKNVAVDFSFSKGLLNQTASEGYTTKQNKNIMVSLVYMF